MGSSSKARAREKKRELGDHVLALRHRLHHALSLGIKYPSFSSERSPSQGNRVKKWECTDAGIQSHVLKTMAAFISCLSSAPSQHPLIKDSISDMLVALDGILQSENERILSQAVDATQKLVSTIGNSVRQYPVLEVIFSLSRLLSLNQLRITTSCAIALNCILTNLGMVRGANHREIWEALEKTKTIRSIADALQKFVGGVQPIECFTAMTALLTTILWKWPSARYHVWSNNMLMVKVERFCGNPDSSIAISVLKLYSALALCGHGAMKLLERKELTAKVVQSLGKSHPISVRIEALKLCRHLMSCLKSDIRVSRSSIASHLQCCWHDVEEWEGDDIILFYSLRALSQLIGFSNLVYDHTKESSNKHSEAQELISNLQYILSSTFGRGPRWFAAYILSFFGLYGFANKLGRRMEKALYEQELADVELVLMNGQSYTVHGAILAARCPYLLPQRESHIEERKLDGHHNDLEIGHHREKLIHRVRMSDRVDSDALFRILEYVYTGFTLVDKHLIKQLKVLSKFCELKHLSALLQKKQLSWGNAGPSFDLTVVLNPAGHPFSFSEIIRVPIGWEALVKLVHWFYSGELPGINPDCRWNNIDTELQIRELRAYVELCSLAEFWCLEEVGEESLKVIASCLRSDQRASIGIVQFATKLNQWKIVEIGVQEIAPSYSKLRVAGELEDLDEELPSEGERVRIPTKRLFYI
ncbi:BTB/POZ domain-containing protein, partial [Ananas comosus]